jgi:hypothetical protein
MHMITDKALMFAEKAMVVSTAATAAIADKTIPTNLLRTDNPLYLYVNVEETYVGGTSLVFELIGCDAAAGTGNVVVLHATPVILVAALLAGTQHVAIKLPRKLNSNFLALRVTNGASATTGGKISAGLTDNVPLRA